MNLYQLNLDQHPAVIRHAAGWELPQFIYFLNKAKEVVADQTLDFPVKPIPCEGADRKQNYYCYQVILDDLGDRDSEFVEKTLFEGSEPKLYDEPALARGRKPLTIENRNEDEKTLTFREELHGNRLYLQPNDYQLNKQIDALHTLKDSPRPWHKELISLFSYQDRAFFGFPQTDRVAEWKVLTDLHRDGTEEQRKFVEQALNTPEFSLLEGPPGSGKTTAIIELVIQLAMRGKRVLLCSATHVAIDNVIGRILGRYAEACKDHIVPVRIASNEGDIREDAVKPYHLQKLVQTKKQELKAFFKKQETLSPSQEYLRDNLGMKDDHIERLILESANLVGGTTIGILQHPDIRNSQTFLEPFDYLIVDEASKVPFQEFLVPALHARRWILVGDIHQLSPYVEDSYVSHALAKAIPEMDQPRVLQSAQVKKRLRNAYRRGPVVMFCPESPQAYEDLFPEKVDVVVALESDWKPSPGNLLPLQAADVILCPDTPQFRQWMAEGLFVKAEFIYGKDQSAFHSAIQNRFHRNKKDPTKPHRHSFTWNSDDTWADLLAGKLNQYFGRRDDEKLSAFTQQEVDDLIPYEDAKASVQDLSRVVFPSILELLQRGVGKSARQAHDVKTVFADGLAQTSKDSRFTSLTYQHRMHLQIAETSQKHFYSNNLEPANSVHASRPDREWGYKPIDRVNWIAHEDDSWRAEKKYKNKIIHRREVKDIERSLEDFRDWVNDHPVPKAWNREAGKYEVAVLTFYRAQETELRYMLRKLTGQHRRSRNFDLSDRIQLTLCTVDQFQGQEADMVLLSFTQYTVGAHYHSPNRLNVALTRARHKLILFGNRQWMADKAQLDALNFLGTEFPVRKTY